ncbi:MAG: hypothetical protein KF857_09805 [Fimbriimonadaceae bacterium]|nr:hypothetical protein [Fimbriimonadaceae bacterium]
MRIVYEHNQHPHIKERTKTGPVKRRGHGKGEHLGLNARIAINLTKAVGTMWCAYFFGGLAFVALPDAVKSGSVVTLVEWVSQTFIQLVMLSVIMVGQNIMGQVSDKRAEMTFKDAEAAFHEACEIQKHLEQQDQAINAILQRLDAMNGGPTKQSGPPESGGPPSHSA